MFESDNRYFRSKDCSKIDISDLKVVPKLTNHQKLKANFKYSLASVSKLK